MMQFDFTVAGTPQRVCVSGVATRFEIKEVVDGVIVPYYGDGMPVFIGGLAAENGLSGNCATIADDGDYVIVYSADCCGDVLPEFSAVDAPVVVGPVYPTDPVVPAGTPSIVEFFGDDVSSAAGTKFNDLTIHNPSCCEIKVDTSAGAFTIKPREMGLEKRFAVLIEIINIEVAGDQCKPVGVHFIFINDGSV